jgi:hypothetical protein
MRAASNLAPSKARRGSPSLRARLARRREVRASRSAPSSLRLGSSQSQIPGSVIERPWASAQGSAISVARSLRSASAMATSASRWGPRMGTMRAGSLAKASAAPRS